MRVRPGLQYSSEKCFSPIVFTFFTIHATTLEKVSIELGVDAESDDIVVYCVVEALQLKISVTSLYSPFAS